MPNDHSKLNPSGADRWMTCPGSVVLSAGMPGSESEYADEGTRAHDIAEKWLTSYFAQHGQIPSFADVEMARNVKPYVDEVIRLASLSKKAGVYLEKKVAVNADVYGTADAVVWVPEESTLYVRDLKYGAGVGVDVTRNKQLIIYALATLLTFKYPATLVSIGIVQPRYEHADGYSRSIDFRVSELIDFHADVMDAIAVVAAAESGALVKPGTPAGRQWEDTYLVPSQKGCRWCLAAPKCPMLARKAQAVAKQVFALGLPYDPLALARTLDFLPILEAWINNTREFAYGEAEKGNAIPDYKLVEKQAVRKWLETVDAKDLAKTLGVKPAEIMKKPELLGVTEIQKMAPGKNDKERAEILAPFVSRKSTGHVLVHTSDKREAVAIDAKAAFAELGD